ncbi:oligosaccharide flippase family protein [Algoriphagus sp.]|uniref:lipopolysaccharide biosynthesis protein n=1 Tax=Algoriphagus sp. TaxID=1872435 RepID=UPI00328DB559
MDSKIFKDSYFRNIISLMTGTGVAQLMPILLSPVLTRIYSPYEFGVFAFYFSVSSILNIASTGRLELAILIPEKSKEALLILKSSFIVIIAISFLVLCSIIVFHNYLEEIFNDKINVNYFYLLPLNIIVYGMYQSLNYWYNRNRQFKRLSLNRVLQSLFTLGLQISIGLILYNSAIGLILGSLIAQFVTLIMFFYSFIKVERLFFYSTKLRDIFETIRKYKKFPLVDVPTMLLNLSANHLPNLFFNIVNAQVSAGNYYFSQRILQVPVTLLSASVLDVFKEEASSNYRVNGESIVVFKRTFKLLLYLTVVPSIFLWFFIEDLFILIFGEEWAIAGSFAKILVPSLALRFIANPLSYMIYIAQKQNINFFLMLFLFISILGVFLFDLNTINIVSIISIVYCLYYILNIYISAKLAKVL